MKIKPHFIIGLGNPGSRYASTYHNVGLLFIQNKVPPNSKFQIPPASSSEAGRANSKKFEYLKINSLIFIKPLTFMNESGRTAKEAVKYFRAKPEEVLIVHDDSDIELGKYKISFGRGAAGHHGVESIIKSLGTKNFWRLRIGIRRGQTQTERGTTQKKAGLPAEAYRAKAGGFVLKKITSADKLVWERLFSDLKIL